MSRLIPLKFSAGVTFDRLVTVTAYPAPDWTLQLLLRGPSAIEIQSTPDGTAHRFLVAAMETSDWTPGSYWYSIRAVNGDTVVEVETDEIVIAPNMAEAGDGYDGRQHAQRVLDAIEAVIERRATLDQERYTINNRELHRTPIADLLVLRDRYRAELRRMNAIKRGGLFEKSVRVRFT